MNIIFRFSMFLTFVLFLFSTLSSSLIAQSNDETKREKTKAEKSTKFMQIKEEKGKPVALQTAVTRYQSKSSKNNLTVDLVAVVHIGDKSYYKKLDEQFKNYDVVLYELVAPEGTVIDKKSARDSSNPLRLLQSIPQRMLGLESQLENINYQAKNFVHADMTPDEMAKKMAERGDSALTLMLSTAADMIRQQNLADQKRPKNGDEIADFASLLASMNDPRKMKHSMAKQFTESGALDMGLGKTLDQLLVKDRNAEAMREFTKQVFAGHKKIAIFYGAAHMPDFETRLKKEFGFKKEKQTWVDAWDLTKEPKQNANDPTDRLLQLLKEIGG